MLNAPPGPRPAAPVGGIRDNLVDRIAETERESPLGWIDGLGASLVGAQNKLSQLDAELVRRGTAVHLGPRSFPEITSLTTDTRQPAP